MVLEKLTLLLMDQVGCAAEDVTMNARLDDLNLIPDDRAELAFTLGEFYGVEIPEEALGGFETVEDVVGYIEDRF